MIYKLDNYNIENGIIKQKDVKIDILDKNNIFLHNKCIIVESKFKSKILEDITSEEKNKLIAESEQQKFKEMTIISQLDIIKKTIDDLLLGGNSLW
ncbi:hypothetical protein [Vallitalea guaymasensis]|uniref:hypothetical protein n=1 Tax=Vallitalea guaymasensis TaxID=1185412 RepID=UPI00235376DA|nr:hypothetical protein [Vallitalea guaymasensis]